MDNQNSPRIAFFGTPEFSVPILQSLINSFSVAVVVSQPSKAVGKGMKLHNTPVAELAKKNDLLVLTPERLNDAQFKDSVQAIQVDLAVVVAYGKILPRWLLDWPRMGAVNIHGSLLPQYRGASPIAAAILNGDTQTGLTLIQMSEGMDEGDILATTEVSIEPNDTTQTLTAKLSQRAAEWIVPTLNVFLNGELSPQPQEHEKATYSKIINKTDGQIDFANSPHKLPNMIRAYYPWPGVWGEFKGKRVKLLPGGMVQMEGKKPASLADFRRGYPDFPLTTLP